VAIASGIAVLKTLPRCQQCAQHLEIEIAVRDFIADEEATVFEWSPQPGQLLSVRLPTGQDQQRWLTSNDISVHSMAQQLVVRVNAEPRASDWRIPEDWVDALADELARHDPLTALELPVRCPACEATTTIEFNLEEELLVRLRARQLATLRDIHTLASAYHWSESEILKLPEWRRRQYLTQIAAGGLV